MANRWGPPKPCAVCGGPTSSQYGICQNSRVCRTATERARKKSQVERLRETGSFNCMRCGGPVWPNPRPEKQAFVCTGPGCMPLARKLAKLLRDLEKNAA